MLENFDAVIPSAGVTIIVLKKYVLIQQSTVRFLISYAFTMAHSFNSVSSHGPLIW